MNRKQKTEEFAVNAIMYLVIIILLSVFTFNLQAQVVTQDDLVIQNKESVFKKVYDDFLKYGTFYVAGNINNPYQKQSIDYVVRTNPSGSLYDVPVVENATNYDPFDYRYGFGIRRIARFDYENKEKAYYDGTEKNVALSAPTAAFNGFEYMFHWEKERERGEVFTNHRYFLRHTGKYHIAKIESREEGNVGFKYSSAEIRARLPIGKKFSISAGVIARTHDQAFGYNPVEIWLNETDADGFALNAWYTLGFEYGYDDIYYTQTDQLGNEISDWYWIDEEGTIVAHTDLEFRETVFADLMNRYNREQWDMLDAFAEYAPIVGADFYTYNEKMWVHAYANYILPYHSYFKGDEAFSYLNRNNWGLGGLKIDSELEQWEDYQFGLIMGWKLTSKLGIFVEGEYTKFWDTEIFNSTVGLNFEL
ncbi:MAG: hypothetical protein GOVbin3530_22 [Prokaryotic dsDNA virus sp.]|jgi:hypothetical protein|nr:MAG: hypothetical protein GOVbin3530_22 [Prokaryotic dsDNA virus sp.]|tara:strand:- start:38486 stop:39745 length:1260 start_codon:yes stop_codon:yes gene_type:complete